MKPTKPTFTSQLLTAETFHQRKRPVSHGFHYPVRMVLFDLDELGELDTSLFGFGHNRFSFFSLYDKDYLAPGDASIKEKVKRLVQNELGMSDIQKVYLATAPRYLGYVFNPASFFWCYNSEGQLIAFITDINNTVGDTHYYVIQPEIYEKDASSSERFQERYRQKKVFYVSPFFDNHFDYEFRFSDIRDEFAVRIGLKRGEREEFVGEVYGSSTPLKSYELMKECIRRPLLGVLTMPRILWHAARLRFQRRLKVYSRPLPSSTQTHSVRGPTPFEQICYRFVSKLFSRIKNGQLIMEHPDGRTEQFGEAVPTKKPARLYIKHYRMFSRLIFGSEVAAGETYVDGSWDTDDLSRLLSLFAENKDSLDLRTVSMGGVIRLANRFVHLFRRNTRKGSKKNISAHYDLSNDMFSLFLDRSMTYSCGVYNDENSTLSEAQEQKLDDMLRLGGVQKGDRILEIGCGWGSFAIRAATKFGCQVTCLTLSEEQAAFAREAVKKAGVEDKVQILINDYRDITGQFDRIVSIEMIEAVGEEFIGEFFQICERCLKPDGKVVIQAITLDHSRIPLYRKSCDWIQKYIFPGCFVPSRELLKEKLSAATSLKWAEDRAIGPHYATTLDQWCDRFTEKKEQLKSLGFDEQFIRMWRYYFQYCAAGFRTGQLNTYQFVLSK